MKVPKLDIDALKGYETLIEVMDIPEEITFEPHPDETVQTFKSIATLPINEAYDQLHIHFDKKRRQVLMQEVPIDSLSQLWTIESDFTSWEYRNLTIASNLSLFTEVLILRLQTLDIDYPLILAAAYVTPRKEYTWQEFSAAYYLCVLKDKLTNTYIGRTLFYEQMEKLRLSKYVKPTQIIKEDLQDEALKPYTSDVYSVATYSLNTPPLPEKVYIKYISPTALLPMFIYSKWGIELYAIIPTQATTANKLLKMVNLPENNILQHANATETVVLNLHKEINQINLPNVVQLHTHRLYQLPEIIDINTLLNTTPTGKKADQFLKYPIIRN